MYKLAYGILALVIYNTAFTMDNEAYLQKYHELNDKFIVAVQQNDKELVEKLLDLKVSRCARDQNGDSALSFALDNKNSEILDLLIHKTLNRIKSLEYSFIGCIKEAAQKGNIQDIYMILNAPHMSPYYKKEGIRGALNVACSQNFPQLVAILVEQYSEWIEFTGLELIKASTSGFTEVVRALLKHPDINPFEKDLRTEKTALMCAKEQKNEPLIDLLEKAQRNYIFKLRLKKTDIEREIIQLKRLSQAE